MLSIQSGCLIYYFFLKKSKELTGKDTSRLCGLAGEHLLNIFVLYQIKEKNVRMKELQTIMVNETKVNPSIKEKIIGTSKQIFTVIFPYGSYRRDKIKYKHYFDENKIISSMIKSGCPYDNSCVEVFFAILKKECIYRKSYATIEEIASS